MLLDTNLIIGNQSIRLHSNDTRLKLIIQDLFNHLTYFEMVANPVSKRYERKPSMYFYIYKEKEGYFDFIFSKNNLNDFLYYIKMSKINYRDSFKVMNSVYKENGVKIPMLGNYTPRDNQKYYIDNIVKSKDIHSMLIDLQPGFGKTLIGYFSVVELRTRPAVLIKPSFLKKWVADIKKYSPLEDNEIYIIKGSDSLRELFAMNKQDRNNIKAYIISTRTITNYYESFYTDDFNYAVSPYDFIDFCGIQNILNDESHKEFEAVFKIIMWMNPQRIIGMSATMDSDKKNMNYFYNLLYPRAHRLESLFGIHKYAKLLFYTFSLNNGLFIPHKGMMGYNHVKYEQNLMRNTRLLQDYLEMLKDIADEYYYRRKKEGQKLLLLFSTIDMATLIYSAFTKHYNDLVIKRYVEKDNYDDMLNGDVVISTNGSMGTGIDVPGLITTIQTVPISDKQLNIQALGRLREIEGTDVIYISLYCNTLKAHRDNQIKRTKILKDRVIDISYAKYEKLLGDVGAINENRNKTYKEFSKGFKPGNFKKYPNYSSYGKGKKSFRPFGK